MLVNVCCIRLDRQEGNGCLAADIAAANIVAVTEPGSHMGGNGLGGFGSFRCGYTHTQAASIEALVELFCLVGLAAAAAWA